MSLEGGRCCCLGIGPLEQLYYIVRQVILTAAGDALLKLVALNYSVEVIDNGAQSICRACYNVASLQDKKQAPFTFRD